MKFMLSTLGKMFNILFYFISDETVMDETAGAAAISVLIKDKKIYCVSIVKLAILYIITHTIIVLFLDMFLL